MIISDLLDEQVRGIFTDDKVLHDSLMEAQVKLAERRKENEEV